MTFLEICQWLESSRLGEMVTLSQWGFPILVTTHLLGLGVSVGTIMWMDFRLLGWFLPSVPVPEVYRRVAPLALTGFAVMFLSGIVLFVGYATSAYGNTFFRIKLAALLVAGVNAAAYHLFTERQVATWTGRRLPWPARAAGLVSIGVWTTVVLAGRMMSYTMF
ncbi:MAG: DUF6644 family protein [Vicinamibacterales bacterium]